MNLIPWGGPTARVMSVMNLDAGEILAPLVPGMALSALYVIGVSYYLGLKERKRLGVTKDVSYTVNKVEVSDEEKAWKRPKLIIFNLILTAAIIAAQMCIRDRPNARPMPIKMTKIPIHHLKMYP